MTSILEWGDPPKAEPPEKRAEYYGGGVPGAYAPNMNREWQLKWKAKLCGQRAADPLSLRVEIRKSLRSALGLVQVVVTVYHDAPGGLERGPMTMSMNGTATFTRDDFRELFAAVAEARAALHAYRAEHPVPERQEVTDAG